MAVSCVDGRRGNQTGHWTYGQLWGHYTAWSVSTTAEQLFINHLSDCQNMIESPPPSIIVMRAGSLLASPPANSNISGKISTPALRSHVSLESFEL